VNERLDELVDTKLQVLRFDPVRLRRCRVVLRVTQVELAHALHVAPTAVSAWESGRQLPSEQHAIELEHFMQRAEKVAEEGAD
jgi:DNA-binding transcriptional regulator YiaG